MNQRLEACGPCDTTSCRPRSRPGGQPRSASTRRILALLLASFLVAACGTAHATPEPVALTVAASGGALPLANDLASAYMAAHPNVTVDVQPVGSALAAIQRVDSGQAGLAFSTLAPGDDHLSPLATTQVAWDALALVVHPDNPLSHLTSDQVRQVFTGRVRNWSDLNAGDGIIQVLSREKGSGARAAFDDSLMEGREVTSTALIMPGSRQMLERVVADRQAIGYLSAAWLDSGVKAVPLDGSEARWITVQTVSYPLLEPVFAVTMDPPGPQTARFLEFVAGPTGRSIAAEDYRPIPVDR